MSHNNIPLSKMFFEVNKLYFETIKRETNKLGINPSYRFVFMALKNNPNGLTQKEICDFLHYKASSISTLLVNMENEGLIERKKDEADSRKINVVLTNKGQTLDNKIIEIFEKTDEKMKQYLSSEEIINLKKTLDNITKALKDGE